MLARHPMIVTRNVSHRFKNTLIKLEGNGIKWYNSSMGLNIKNPEVEHLASKMAKAMGVTKTEAIRQALAEKAQIYGIFDGQSSQKRAAKDDADFEAFLQGIWAKYPAIRESRFTKEDYDALFE